MDAVSHLLLKYYHVISCMLSQVDGRDQVVATAAFLVMVLCFFAYTVIMVIGALNHRKAPPQSISYVDLYGLLPNLVGL